MESKSFILQDVSTDLLRKLLGISMSVSKSETLNFTLSQQKISGIASNEADSLYKKWSVALSDLAKIKTGDTIPGNLKCSIYKGDEFSRRILSFFGQFVNMKMEHNGSEIKKIELFKVNEKGVVTLKINLLTASTATAFVDYSAEFVAQIFSPAKETRQFEFELDVNDLSEVSKLSKLSTNPEQQTSYVNLYHQDGMLKATDKMFDIILKEEGVEPFDSIDIDKTLWSMIDKDQYRSEIHSIGENKIMINYSNTRDVTIAIVLLAKTDTTIDFEDFEDNDSSFV